MNEPTDSLSASPTGVNEQENEGGDGNAPDGGGGEGSSDGEGKKDGGFSKGALIGVAVASAIVAVILVLLLLLCLRRRRRQRRLSQIGKRGGTRDDEDCYFDTPNSTGEFSAREMAQVR